MNLNNYIKLGKSLSKLMGNRSRSWDDSILNFHSKRGVFDLLVDSKARVRGEERTT